VSTDQLTGLSRSRYYHREDVASLTPSRVSVGSPVGYRLTESFRFAEDSDVPTLPVADDQTERLMNHVFEGPGLPYRFTFRNAGKKGVGFLLFLSIFLTLLGGMLTSFEFKVHGIAGVLSDLGTPKSSLQQFSIVSSAAAIAAQAPARYLGSIGPAAIAFVYIAFAFLVPLAVLALVSAQWVLPMTLRMQKRLYTAQEALTAWSALEVFMSSIVSLRHCILECTYSHRSDIPRAGGRDAGNWAGERLHCRRQLQRSYGLAGKLCDVWFVRLSRQHLLLN
jgi:hypothetical protein